METVLLTFLVLLLASHSEVVMPALATLDVFAPGNLSTENFIVKETSEYKPPKPLLIFTPTNDGTYPVILFLHGTCLDNSVYHGLLDHISSHGYIVVAPQLYTCLKFSVPWSLMPSKDQRDEIEHTALVANWLYQGLESVLAGEITGNVSGDLNRLALAGHSRGGKTAFAIAKIKLEVNFSALVGIDPVAGIKFAFGTIRTDPQILNYQPESFNLSMPVAIIGTGLGAEHKIHLLPACAAKSLNHLEFFCECKSPAGYFVVEEYGHLDMLDNKLPPVAEGMSLLCKENEPKYKDHMRKTVGGITVAFLKAYFEGDKQDYMTIIRQPQIANPPAKLHPVLLRNETDETTCPFHFGSWIGDHHLI